MKTTGLIQKLACSQKEFFFLIAICFTITSCSAQNIWEASEVKAKRSVYNCEKQDKHIFVKNSTYIDPMETRTEYNSNGKDYSYVSLLSHDQILDAFKESFSDDKLTQLGKMNDYILLIFNVDENGQILGLRFGLRKETYIAPKEIEILEQELMSNVKFVVIGKEVEDSIFYRVLLRVYFSEIHNGEIRSARNSENLKSKYEN